MRNDPWGYGGRVYFMTGKRFIGLQVMPKPVSGRVGSGQAQPTKTQEVTFGDVRGLRYCEVFLVKADSIFMYNTTGLNECPPAQWDALDTEKIKAQHGAGAVFKNRPHLRASPIPVLVNG